MLQGLLDFLFYNGGYSPHGICIAWDPWVLWMHVGSDAVIALSYFAIPALIALFLRHRADPSLHAPAMLFVAFILACGLTHLISLATFWLPIYGFQGIAKLATALVSAATALALFRMFPDALRIPSPRDLQAKIRELEVANAELREFTYAASHDLKSPVQSLEMGLQMLGEDLPAQGEAREILCQLRGTVRRMSRGTEQLAVFADLLAADPVETGETDLDDVVDAALESLAGALARSGAEIVRTPLPRVRGHRGRLVLLFEALLSNALRFAHPNTPPRIELRAAVPDGPGEVLIEVADNGIGMTAAQKAVAFEAFRRLGPPGTQDGSGLGLAVVRRVAALHGGRVEVRSRDGGGTLFRVHLAAARAGPRRAGAGNDLRALRVAGL